VDKAGPDEAAKAEALLALGQDCAARLTDPWRTADHGALLYDDKGLPR
jgi:antitoxin VapB